MKLKLYSFDPIPLHVSGKCAEATWPGGQQEVWELFCLLIKEFELNQSIKTHAFVLMHNHYHWLCSPPADMSETEFKNQMDWFHEALSYEIKFELQMEHILKTGMNPAPLFTQPPKIIPLEHIEAYRNTYAYIYRNPVSAGIVERAEHYPFSSLPYVLGRTKEDLRFRCHDNMNLIYDPKRLLGFINDQNRLNSH